MTLFDLPQRPSAWAVLGGTLASLGIPLLLLAFWLGQLSTGQEQTQHLAAANAKAIGELARISARHEKGLSDLERQFEHLLAQ